MREEGRELPETRELREEVRQARFLVSSELGGLSSVKAVKAAHRRRSKLLTDIALPRSRKA